jgi:hypothetical protein
MSMKLLLLKPWERSKDQRQNMYVFSLDCTCLKRILLFQSQTLVYMHWYNLKDVCCEKFIMFQSPCPPPPTPSFLPSCILSQPWRFCHGPGRCRHRPGAGEECWLPEAIQGAIAAILRVLSPLPLPS